MAGRLITVGNSASYFSARRNAPGEAPNLPKKRAFGTVPAPSRTTLPAEELVKASEDWFLDCEYRAHSPETTQTRRVFQKNLGWFLQHRTHAACDTTELKEFFH